MTLQQEALEYHSRKPHGKLEIAPSKPCLTQHDLALAYTPGVAEPCRAIQKNPEDVFTYTAKGNLVAIITNGTAVLGLGNIGPLAGKPVMEGKALLFKRFADMDAIDLELDTEDADLFIRSVEILEPSFGGINLEDIKAPECFYIEEELKKRMKIPVFHDDQHGTAIISGAALLNALEVIGKELAGIRIVFNGCGAAAIATARFYVELGAKRENIMMCDRHGVVYQGREVDMNPYKQEFAAKTRRRTLADAMVNADVFVGLSVANVVTREMLMTMGPKPIIFTLANPDPEIKYEDAIEARPDAIIATGRSDYPNQVNNVLGFPFIFRGALDVRATQINEEMKVAAAQALAALAKEDVPDSVVKAYGLRNLHFGPDYLIPKPLDPRVLLWVAPAVAGAAIRSEVARIKLDIAQYTEELEARQGKSHEVMRVIFNKAKADPRRVVMADGEHQKMIRAAHQIVHEGYALPVILGNPETIRRISEELQVSLEGIEIIDPRTAEKREQYARKLYELRCRKGINQREAWELAGRSSYFGTLMLEMGDAAGMIDGPSFHYPEVLRPPLQIIRTCSDCAITAGVHIITTRDRVIFMADTTVNIQPDAEQLAQIAILTARLARDFNIEPRVAMLSFSNFGGVRHPRTELVQRAVEIARQKEPGLVIEGEMQASTALNEEMLNSTYPFNSLRTEANVLVCPSLEASNIAIKLVNKLGRADVVGPILVGMRKPVYVLQHGQEVNDIVNLVALAVVEAQKIEAATGQCACGRNGHHDESVAIELGLHS